MQTRAAVRHAVRAIELATANTLTTTEDSVDIQESQPIKHTARRSERIQVMRQQDAQQGLSQPENSSQPSQLKRPSQDATGKETSAKTPRKRTERVPTKRESQSADELPHGLGRIHSTKVAVTITNENLTSSREVEGQSNEEPRETLDAHTLNNSSRNLRPRINKSESVQTADTPATKRVSDEQAAEEDTDNNDDPKESKGNKTTSNKKRIARKSKDNPYGLMPGHTPFPDQLGPSSDECEEVHKILTELHGEFKSPDKIPPPSTSVAGCGEVPDLVDALIRTLISGHTAMQNANLAIQDVIEKYGQWDKDSIGAGSIDWNKVRLSEEHEIVSAVKRAGLGLTKGKDIKAILGQVYEENQLRSGAYRREIKTGEASDASGSRELTRGQKEHQILKIENGVLTLDHIRGLTSDEAMLELTKFPGIGVKTASCLILFCLQQPSFAVDTHVWRLCKWLKWVPQKASRDDTYMHCEVRVPDHLKYGLHQLFIRHGKECGRCRSGTVEGTAEWESVICPLEHLLDRFDKRKTKSQLKTTKTTEKTMLQAIQVTIKEANGVSDKEHDEGGMKTTDNGTEGDEMHSPNIENQRVEVHISSKKLEGYEGMDDSNLSGTSQSDNTQSSTTLTSLSDTSGLSRSDDDEAI